MGTELGLSWPAQATGPLQLLKQSTICNNANVDRTPTETRGWHQEAGDAEPEMGTQKENHQFPTQFSVDLLSRVDVGSTEPG